VHSSAHAQVFLDDEAYENYVTYVDMSHAIALQTRSYQVSQSNCQSADTLSCVLIVIRPYVMEIDGYHHRTVNCTDDNKPECMEVTGDHPAALKGILFQLLQTLLQR
jgi:hypothetical protein